ncbi:MAG: HmuY family protein [bacterium]
MKRPKRVALFFMTILVLQSCFKEDQQLPEPVRGDVMTDTIAMTENYGYQVYFRLDSGRVVSTNPRANSDLGFECSKEGWKIVLNTADFMKATDLGEVTFGQPYDTTGLKWKFDKSDGNPDSLAIGSWFTVNGQDTVSLNHVYLLQRGMDELGNDLGIRQIIFDSLKRGTYYFRYTGLNGGAIYSTSVNKDPSVNYLWFSLDGAGSIQHNEPEKTSYDLLFTQYTTLLFTDLGEAYPYLVTGVLLNRIRVEAAIDTIHDFSSITFDIAKNLSYSSALDAIGYDWKFYDFDAGSYTVRTGLSYVIRDAKGYLYKLRFIGYYNKQGQKGYPSVEFQRL